MEEKIAEMLKRQLNDNTREYFKDLKYGDVLKLKPIEELRQLQRDGLLLCSYIDSSMNYYAQNTGNIVFGKNFSVWGFISIGDYNWSLDMMEYVNLYKVDLI